jgi:hypothetical protein
MLERDVCDECFINRVMSVSEYQRLLESQEYACAICDQRFGECDCEMGKPHVDFCEEAGRVRGILCGGCLYGIRAFNSSQLLLEQGVEYLDPAEALEEVLADPDGNVTLSEDEHGEASASPPAQMTGQ